MVWQQEHRLTYEDFLGRYKFVVACILCLFFLLSIRLFHLQVVSGNHLREVSENQRTRVIVERAPRGLIFDKDNRVIVGNKTAFVALFYPFSQDSRPSGDVLARLRDILPEKDISIAVAQGLRTGQVVRLSDNLSRTEMFRLQEQRLILPGISVISESRRDCISPEDNAHLIGYLSEISPDELEDLAEEGYKTGDWIGKNGLEQGYNSYLRGQDGGWQIEVDARGRQTRIVRHIPSQIGNSVYTTIDERLQQVAGNALRNSTTGRGAVVVLDARTGAVRALVSSPAFDPNTSLTREFRKNLIDKKLPLFNRTVQGLYAPGSTFKIVTFAAAVSEGGISPSLAFFCPGSFTLGNKTFGCWYKKGHGQMTLIPALANSCNVYFYQLGLKIGARLLEKYARAFSLGEKTGVELPSEKKGLVPGAEWKLRKMHENWQQGDTVNVAIGQGPLWVTPFQMACLIAAVANSGPIYQPYIVNKVVSQRNETLYEAKPHVKQTVDMPEHSWQLLHQALEEAVTNGTGKGCQLPGIKVAGKTGTAQNPQGDDHAWFVSYAPADNPQYAIAVIVENGGHGGTAAVPVTRRIYETAFDLVRSSFSASSVAVSTAPH